jgi:membrane-bound lytic murein transglycosylase MltF
MSLFAMAACADEVADSAKTLDVTDSANTLDPASTLDVTEPPPVYVDEEIAAELDAPLDDVWPAMAEPKFGDLDVLVERAEIRILTTITLGSYFIDRGHQRGTVFEMSQMLEKYVRDKFGRPARTLKVTIIPVRRDQLIPSLIAGHGDVIFANMTVTPERSQLVDFTTPFSNKVRELLVTGPSAPDISVQADLAGKEIVVPRASSYFQSIAELNEQFVNEGLETIQITETDPRLEAADILEMTSAGLLPMTVVDDHRVRVWAKVFKNLTVHEDIVFRENAEVALAMRKGSPQLKELLDTFVHENRLGTLMTNILVKKYMKNTAWAKPALEREPFRRFEQLAGLFRTYGMRYDLDWLMLASFSFQESGFDQSVRSPVGAIGVMQVMPATAADRAVNIADIEELENNVHAGSKYLNLLRAHYFSDEEMDPTERMLFTMAGYNAGPNRINRLRRVAAERGLDPNVWFNNVELVVAAQVGQEPVRYVGNIYRYYIAYSRVLETMENKEAIQDLN